MDPFLAEGNLDEEEAQKSIVVSNISDNLTYKDVIMYFQRGANGGGEVDSARYPDDRDKSTVIVTFDLPETVETAIRRSHRLGGIDITVERYSVSPFIPEVFEYVQARVNPILVHSTAINQNLLQLLQDEFGVVWKPSKSVNSFYLQGSLEQITLCHKYIIDSIFCSQHQNVAATQLSAETGPTLSVQVSSSQKEISRRQEIRECAYQAVPVILKFMFSVPKYRKQLIQIEKDYHIRVRGEEEDNKVVIQSLSSCTQKKFDEGCEEYIKLYKEFFDGSMMSKDVVLYQGPNTSYSSVQDAIDAVQPRAPVIIEKTASTPRTWRFYGEEKEVKTAVQDICKRLNIDHPFKRAARKHVDNSEQNRTEDTTGSSYLKEGSRNGISESARPVDSGPTAINSNDNVEKFLTKKGFQLSVRLSDITEEQVDVIVNCNDEYLCGFDIDGLPKSIVKKGGNCIFDEAKAEAKRRKVKAGEIIITRAGKLPCTNVMHVITWMGKKGNNVQKNIVHDACLECLKKAHSKPFRSIAFPAVGTGKPGMALKSCALAMINAVEDYMKTSDPKIRAVTDIRFVHVDHVAFETFKHELERRYGSCKVQSSSGSVNDPLMNPGMQDVKYPAGFADNHKSNETEKDNCAICLDHLSQPVTLPKCKHQFCKDCIDRAFQDKKKCPTCGVTYGMQTGNMPRGTMNHYTYSYRNLPGHERCGTIEINYHFSSGTQGPEHPNPGQFYSGTSRTAYLPDNPEGREVLRLLRKAFDARLTFTIGTSVTTGQSNTVTWNDIHHKTTTHGGATGFGYPDPDYLKRVKEELAAKGIS